MKIIREGDCAFLLYSGQGYGFNLKLISRVEVESMRLNYGQAGDDLFVQVWSSGGSSQFTIPRSLAEQLFQDSPWAIVLRDV